MDNVVKKVFSLRPLVCKIPDPNCGVPTRNKLLVNKFHTGNRVVMLKFKKHNVCFHVPQLDLVIH